VDNGMITQTMKMKRKVILDKHMPEIEALYSEA
jgi:long-subunit acyl-CoA synthetase (AMP-forming)